MKKQTKSNIKAHLIRSSFYVLLLLAVCVIPLALAQRTTTKHGVNSPKLAAKKMAEHPRSVVPAGRSRGSLVTNATNQQPNAAHPNRFSRAPALPRRAGATITGPDGVSCAYDLNVGTDTFVPGVDDIGNHTDDGTTFITLPFTVNLWGQDFTSANVGSNGELEFGTADASFSITCPTGRPVPTAMGPYWGDQCTGACFNTLCTGCGIFTTTAGTEPNRIFYIEYRTNYYGLDGQNQDLLDYEVALFENGSPPFEYIYQNIEAALVPNDSELTVNQKQDDGCLTEFGCDTTGGQIPPVSSGMALIAAPVVGTPTPTPTASPTCPPGNPNGGAGVWTAGASYPINIVRYGFVQTATDFYVFGGVSDGSEVNNVNRYNLGTGTWTPLSPMPFTSEAPTCALDASTGIAYCAQGDTGNGFASYNTATDTWTPLANTPTVDNYGSASGAFNGKVFLAGDSVGGTTAAWVYDIASDTWSSATAAPDNFFLAGYQQVGQFLYVVGGFNANTIPTNNATTWRLDMSSAPGTWETGPAFTQGRADFGLAYDPGTNKLYAMGGDLQGNGFFDSTNEVDELDVSGWPGGTWNPSPPDLPLPIRQANQAGFNGASQIWSVGGLDGSTFIFLNEVWSRTNGGCGPTPTPGCSLDPWQEVAPMTTDLYGAAGASDGTNFYAAGGYSFSQGITLNILQKYDGTSWTTLSPMPQSQIEGCGVYYPPTNTFYVFGGEDAVDGTNYNLTQIYDIASDTWSTGANMPDVRSFAACGYVPATGMIYVVSGYNTGDVTSAQNTTWQYDPVGNSWTDLTAQAAFPHPAGGFAYGVINDKLYIAGGRDAAVNIINDTYEFDPTVPAYTQKADEPGTFQNNVPGSASAQNLLWVFGGGNPFAAGGAEAKAGIAAPSKAHITKSSKSSFPLEFVKRLFGHKSNAPDTDSSGRFYNPATDTWTASPNLNEARSFSTGAAITDSLIIAAGGFDGASTVASAETENVCAGGGTPTPTPTATVTPTPSGSCPPQITESTSQEIVSNNSVSCNNGVGHADNSYFRAFNMGTFTGGAEYDINAVEFGVEQATSGTGTGQPVEVRLYANHGSPFPAGDWQSNMIADIPINVPDQSLTVFVQPASVIVPTGTLELVYELFTPNGEDVGNLFFVGSNPDPETGLSYLEAADCGVTVPTPTGDIGFPDMHIVFNVDGTCPGGTPTPTPTVTPTPIITPTPTVTPTPIITPTPTPVITPTPIITPTPTPRPSPTPRPRPTPHPRPTPP